MTPPSKFLFFPTQSSGTTTWRDEADHYFETTVTATWSTTSYAPGMIGYRASGGNNYTLSKSGDLEPANVGAAYANIATGGNLLHWVTEWFGGYDAIAVDFRQHPDSTSTTSYRTALEAVLSANTNWDWVVEFENTSGTVAMLKRYNDTGYTYSPDWSVHMGEAWYWNSTPKTAMADYGVGSKLRFYWFDDATAITSSDWPPTQVT